MFIWMQLPIDLKTKECAISERLSIERLEFDEGMELKEWREKVSIDKENIVGCSLFEKDDSFVIRDVFFAYSRYEEFKFINLLVEADKEKNQEIILKKLNETLDIINKDNPMDIFIKHKSFNSGNDEVLKYNNFMQFYLKDELSREKLKGYEKTDYDKYAKYQRISYLSKKKGVYTRELEVFYILNDRENIKSEEIKTLVHSENLFYRRAHLYHRDLTEKTAETVFIDKSVEMFHLIWSRIRTYFFVTSKFPLRIGESALKNKLFINVLESFAQLDNIMSKTEYEVGKLDLAYNNRFERILFNFDKKNMMKEKDTLIDELERIKKYREDLGKNNKNINLTLGKLYDQVLNLRDDINSYGNIILQWLMAILSIVLIVWGAAELMFSKIIEENLFGPLYWVLLGVAVLFISYALIGKRFIGNFNHYSRKKTNKLIKGWLTKNSDEVDLEGTVKYYSEKIKKYKDSEIKEIMYANELYNYVLIGLSFKKIECDKAIEIVDDLIELIKEVEK